VTLPPPAQCARLLIVAPNWLGDAAMATPALRALRRHFQDAHITIAAKPALCELLAGTEFADSLHPMPGRIALAGMLGDRFRLHAPDLAIVLPHSFRAALYARVVGARHRVGYDRGGRRGLLTHAVPPNRENGRITPLYTAQEYLNLVQAVGAEDDGAGLELAADPELTTRIRAQLDPKRPVLAVVPGAAFGPSKLWPAARYAETLDQLHETVGVQAIVLTGPNEKKTRRAVIDAVRTPVIATPDMPPGIASLKAAIAASDLYLGNDTGPRHIAVAFGKPVVCIMGPTSPVYTDSPWERGEVLRIDVDCGPCQQPVCKTDGRCMTGIPAARAVEAVQRHLAATNPRV